MLKDQAPHVSSTIGWLSGLRGESRWGGKRLLKIPVSKCKNFPG